MHYKIMKNATNEKKYQPEIVDHYLGVNKSWNKQNLTMNHEDQMALKKWHKKIN